MARNLHPVAHESAVNVIRLLSASLLVTACTSPATSAGSGDSGAQDASPDATGDTACGALPPATSCLQPCSETPAAFTCSDGMWTCPFAGIGYDCDAGSPTTLVCNAALSAICNDDAGGIDCPASTVGQISAAWCARNPRAGAVLGACGGYDVLPEGSGTDGVWLFMYAADGGPLSAVVSAEDLGDPVCRGGLPGFALPLACFSDQGADLTNAFNGPGGTPGCLAFDGGTAPDGGDGG